MFIVEKANYVMRTQTLTWSTWSEHDLLVEANVEAQRLGWARVVKRQILNVYEEGKLIRRNKKGTI